MAEQQPPRGDDEAGATTEVRIGGVDLRELQAAHAQFPTLNRWMNFTLKMMPDLYDSIEAQQAANKQLHGRLEALEGRVAELAPQGDEDGSGKSEGDGGGDVP